MEKVPRAVFTKEFKEEAAKMVIDGNLGISEVCRRLSLAKGTLERWIRQARQGGIPDPGRRNPVTDEQMELTRLKRENKQLKMEREILKNAAAYFARESQKSTR